MAYGSWKLSSYTSIEKKLAESAPAHGHDHHGHAAEAHGHAAAHSPLEETVLQVFSNSVF